MTEPRNEILISKPFCKVRYQKKPSIIPVLSIDKIFEEQSNEFDSPVKQNYMFEDSSIQNLP